MSKIQGPIFLLGIIVNCREVNKQLASGVKLSLFQRIILWCHLRICYSCRRFSKHLTIISRSVRSIYGETKVTPEELKELQEKVLKELRRHD